MYAIVKSGGHQYRVAVGDQVEVQLLDAAPGDTVTLGEVLLLGTDDPEAGHVRIGTPYVEGAAVRATVMGETLGQKLVVYRYKPKNRYKSKTGHRQRYTRLKIEQIDA
jgi:large subunit ribosomal protein L21